MREILRELITDPRGLIKLKKDMSDTTQLIEKNGYGQTKFKRNKKKI